MQHYPFYLSFLFISLFNMQKLYKAVMSFSFFFFHFKSPLLFSCKRECMHSCSFLLVFLLLFLWTKSHQSDTIRCLQILLLLSRVHLQATPNDNTHYKVRTLFGETQDKEQIWRYLNRPRETRSKNQICVW